MLCNAISSLPTVLSRILQTAIDKAALMFSASAGNEGQANLDAADTNSLVHCEEHSSLPAGFFEVGWG